jgi:putative heme transporter
MKYVETLLFPAPVAPLTPQTCDSLAIEAERGSGARSFTSLVRVPLIIFGVAVVGASAVMNRSSVVLAGHELKRLSGKQILLLFAVLAIHKGVHATLLWGSLPGLSFRRAVLVNEVHTGATNATIGGSAIGAGLKFSLLKASGLADRSIGFSIVCTATATKCGPWLLAWMCFLPSVLRGTATMTERWIVAVSTFFLLGFSVFGIKVIRQPSVAVKAASALARVRSRITRWIPRHLEKKILSIDLDREVLAFHSWAHAVLRTRAGHILVSTIVSQVTIGLVLLTALAVMSPNGVPIVGVLGVFALARAIGSIGPLPGGLGVMDVSLAAGLGQLGIPASRVVAAIATFRLLTYVLPIFVGPLCLTAVKRAVAANE